MKKIRQTAVQTLTNVIQWSADTPKKILKRIPADTEIILELACGRGDYSVALAQKFPEKTIIGVDRKGDRIWHGAQTALDTDIKNVFFLKMEIEQLESVFLPQSISEIWITFPDPHPTKRRANRRLTSPRFLEIFKKILTPLGRVHLKTDVPELIAFTKEGVIIADGTILEQIDDIYARALQNDLLSIQTTYEKKHISEGKKIYYLSFTL